MRTHPTTTTLRRTLAIAGLGAALAGGLAACRNERSDEPPHQFLPDMDDSPKFKPQTETEFFTDGRAMRPGVKGAVAFGNSARPEDRSRVKYLRESAELWDGIDPNGKPLAENEPAFVARIPSAAVEEFRAVQLEHGTAFPSEPDAMRAMIQRGQQRFNIYCSVCHGTMGEGGDPSNLVDGKPVGGVVGQRWLTPVPSYHDPKYSDPKLKTGRDGYIFSVIRNGVPDVGEKPPKMPSYADKVSEIDAWAIVAYIRTLQHAWKEAGSPAAQTAPSSPATPAIKPEGSK
jgi:mono/diheme cytochrome c family protein